MKIIKDQGSLGQLYPCEQQSVMKSSILLRVSSYEYSDSTAHGCRSMSDSVDTYFKIQKYRMHELTSTFLFSFIFSHTHKFRINCAENTTKAVSVLVNYKCVFLRVCMH